MIPGRDQRPAAMCADIACAAGDQNGGTTVDASALFPVAVHPQKLRIEALAVLGLIVARRPTVVEQQIEGARIGGQIAPEQPARLEPNSPGPFEADVLHPFGSAGAAARKEIEQAARSLDDADIRQ